MTEQTVSAFVTVRELAAELRVPTRTIYAWMSEQKAPPAHRIGKRLLFKREELDAWIEERRVTTAA